MKHVCFILLLTGYCNSCFSQNFPALGRNQTVEICNWNLEWFGKTTPGYGPANDSLQEKLVQTIMRSADIDIWALCEVSGKKAFDSLLSNLPQYAYCLAPYLPEQKTALIYKSSMFSMHSATLLATGNKDSFSTLRFPFEIKLIPKFDIGIDTLTLLLLHLKANTGNDSLKMLAYNSRKRSAEWLNMYVRMRKPNSFSIVLGDWNDDLDKSIYNNLPSPFIPLLNSNYTFISKKFTDSDKGTTASFPNAIDHQLISPALYEKYLKDSCFIYRPDIYVQNYSTLCSDHFPVYSMYNTYKTELKLSGMQSIPAIFPNPASSILHLSNCEVDSKIELLNSLGSILFSDHFRSETSIDVSRLTEGLYYLRIFSENSVFSYPVQIVHE